MSWLVPCFHGLCKTNTWILFPCLESCLYRWYQAYWSSAMQVNQKLSGYRHLSYDTRLHLLGAVSLELRQLKVDLVMMYKIWHGLVAVDTLFSVRLEDRTRGDFKILKPRCNVNSRAHSFACRRLNCCNSLPNDVRNASSVFVFIRLVSKCDFTCVLTTVLQYCCLIVSGLNNRRQNSINPQLPQVNLEMLKVWETACSCRLKMLIVVMG